MNVSPRILVAGIGNIFLADDAFGVVVAQRMMRQSIAPNVCVKDFGIRGLDLVYALAEGWDLVVLIDAMPRGRSPGTLSVVEPALPAPVELAPGSELIDGHSMNPEKVLQLVVGMGGKLGRILVVGCEPTPFDAEQDMQMDLSPPVAAAVEPAIGLIQSLVNKYPTLSLEACHESVGSLT